MKRSDALVDWDDEDAVGGNTDHIAEHGLDQDEVESVLLDDGIPVEVDRSNPQHRVVRGYTFTDRWVVVVYDVLSEDPPIIRPVTAFEPD